MSKLTVVVDGVTRDKIDVSSWDTDPEEYPEVIDGRWSFTVTVVDTDMTWEQVNDAFKDRRRFVLSAE